MDDLKERLRALYRFLSGEGELDDLWFGDEPPPGHKRRGTYWWRSSHLRAIDEAAARLEALEAKVKDAVVALEPFAKNIEYVEFLEAADDDYVERPPFKAGDYRKAAATLAKIQEAPNA